MKSELQKKYEKLRIKAFIKYAQFISYRRKADKKQNIYIDAKIYELQFKQLLTNKN